MQQFAVQKQGSLYYTNWSDRLLTVDTVNNYVFLSKKDSPELLSHHKLRLVEVQLWPHYLPRHIDEEMESESAVRTVRLKGIEEDVTIIDEANLADLRALPKFQKWQRQPARDANMRKVPLMLRFSSVEGLRGFVLAVHAMNARSLQGGLSGGMRPFQKPGSSGSGEGSREQSATATPNAVELDAANTVEVTPEDIVARSGHTSPRGSGASSVASGSFAAPTPDVSGSFARSPSAPSSSAPTPKRGSIVAGGSPSSSLTRPPKKTPKQSAIVRIKGSIEEIKKKSANLPSIN